MIYCLMFTGKSISKMVCDALFRAACRMVKEEKDHIKVVHDDCQGYVKTDWQNAQLGTLSGVLFEADIATIKGQTHAQFMVRTRDLELVENEEGEWIEVAIPVPVRRKRKQKPRGNQHEWN